MHALLKRSHNYIAILLSDARCRPPPLVSNAMVNFNSSTHSVTLTCLAGYQFVGGLMEQVLTCDADGNWPPTGHCEVLLNFTTGFDNIFDQHRPSCLHLKNSSTVHCPTLENNSSKVNSSDTQCGTAIQVVCDDGFRINGQLSLTLTCTPTGQWSTKTGQWLAENIKCIGENILNISCSTISTPE